MATGYFCDDFKRDVAAQITGQGYFGTPGCEFRSTRCATSDQTTKGRFNPHLERTAQWSGSSESGRLVDSPCCRRAGC